MVAAREWTLRAVRCAEPEVLTVQDVPREAQRVGAAAWQTRGYVFRTLSRTSEITA